MSAHTPHPLAASNRTAALPRLDCAVSRLHEIFDSGYDSGSLISLRSDFTDRMVEDLPSWGVDAARHGRSQESSRTPRAQACTCGEHEQ